LPAGEANTWILPRRMEFASEPANRTGFHWI
jgi:hypothetical protein